MDSLINHFFGTKVSNYALGTIFFFGKLSYAYIQCKLTKKDPHYLAVKDPRDYT